MIVDISEAMEDSMDHQERRDAAIKRIKDKRDFKTHVVTYVVVNLFLVGVWAIAADTDRTTAAATNFQGRIQVLRLCGGTSFSTFVFRGIRSCHSSFKRLTRRLVNR